MKASCLTYTKSTRGGPFHATLLIQYSALSRKEPE